MMEGREIWCTPHELYLESCLAGNHTLHLKRRVNSSSGAKRSSIRGRGMEFFESRPYVRGDEIRNIDWKVSARLNTVHTKIFTEEKDRLVYIILDLRSNMFFGSKICFKSVLAACIAARLGRAALNGQDHVGALILSDSVTKEISCSSNSKNFSRILGHIAGATKNSALPPEESLSQAMSLEEAFWPGLFNLLNNRVKAGSLVLILSDFFDLNQQAKSVLYKLRKKADLLCLNISDKLEHKLADIGRVGLSYDQQKIIINTSDKLWQQNFKQKITKIEKEQRELLASLSIPVINFYTDESIDLGLNKIFAGQW